MNWVNGSYKDVNASIDLLDSLNTTYAGDSWMKEGSQWSIVYGLAGWTLVIAGINAVLLVLGGWFYKPRMVGMFCHSFLMIFDLASLIVTHKYRYRDQGKLAALSTQLSHSDDGETFSGDRTYIDDAAFIDKIWVWQLILFIVCLLTTNIGCFKCCTRSDIRDSQVRSTMASQQYR